MVAVPLKAKTEGIRTVQASFRHKPFLLVLKSLRCTAHCLHSLVLRDPAKEAPVDPQAAPVNYRAQTESHRLDPCCNGGFQSAAKVRSVGSAVDTAHGRWAKSFIVFQICQVRETLQIGPGGGESPEKRDLQVLFYPEEFLLA